MGQHDALKRGWGNAGIIALILLILGAGFCCLDQGVMHYHGIPLDLCSIAIVVAPSLSVAALVRLGLIPTVGRPLFATIPLAVPKPPPRPIRFS